MYRVSFLFPCLLSPRFNDSGRDAGKAGGGGGEQEPHFSDVVGGVVAGAVQPNDEGGRGGIASPRRELGDWGGAGAGDNRGGGAGGTRGGGAGANRAVALELAPDEKWAREGWGRGLGERGGDNGGGGGSSGGGRGVSTVSLRILCRHLRCGIEIK